MWQTVLIIYIIIIIAVVAYRWWDRRNYLSSYKRTYYSDLITMFFEDPNKEDFAEVWDARLPLINTVGRSIKFWLWGVHLVHPDYFSPSQSGELATWSRDIERGLRRVSIRPTTELLDCIWALYFATGNPHYPNIIKNVAEHSRDGAISAAAKWSYESIMKTSPWNDTVASESDTAAASGDSGDDAGSDDETDDNAALDDAANNIIGDTAAALFIAN